MLKWLSGALRREELRRHTVGARRLRGLGTEDGEAGEWPYVKTALTESDIDNVLAGRVQGMRASHKNAVSLMHNS